MKSIFILLAVLLLHIPLSLAQVRVVDATDQTPVSAASVFDASGNMVGFTWSDGSVSEIPQSAYPITVRCIGYEQVTIDGPENKVWSMTPMTYELEEVVIVPVKRNVLKQLFYVREYFSMSSNKDTITFFMEHMADRFVPTTKDSKFRGDEYLRVLTTRNYARFKILGRDSVACGSDAAYPSMLSIFEIEDDEMKAPESFLSSTAGPKIHEEPGKSGPLFIMKQNSQTFTMVTDILAFKKNHTWSPWPLKILGFTMELNQMYFTQTYRVNDKGIYLPKDLLEASYVIEADGKGKHLRKMLDSDKPIKIRSMLEFYVVDKEFLSKEEAKEESKNKPADVRFDIPSTIPPLNKATQQLVERAHAENKK